ncbi:hypothetical protein B0H10DRAFT_2378185 [Mycena sp. CBHHK59/15]|nr:hypothetical protein B0H10DRAFT_2378185 [Mycena sp. CBHHK59/15]
MNRAEMSPRRCQEGVLFHLRTQLCIKIRDNRQCATVSRSNCLSPVPRRGRGNSADHGAGSGDIRRNQADAEVHSDGKIGAGPHTLYQELRDGVLPLMRTKKPVVPFADEPMAASMINSASEAKIEIQKGVRGIASAEDDAEEFASRLNGGIPGDLEVIHETGDWRGRTQCPVERKPDDRTIDVPAEANKVWARMPAGFARRGPDLLDGAAHSCRAGGYTAQRRRVVIAEASSEWTLPGEFWDKKSGGSSSLVEFKRERTMTAAESQEEVFLAFALGLHRPQLASLAEEAYLRIRKRIRDLCETCSVPPYSPRSQRFWDKVHVQERSSLALRIQLWHSTKHCQFAVTHYFVSCLDTFEFARGQSLNCVSLAGPKASLVRQNLMTHCMRRSGPAHPYPRPFIFPMSLTCQWGLFAHQSAVITFEAGV